MVGIFRFIVIAIFVLLPLSTTAANADCYYDGALYPTGTKLGDLECQPDGSWK